MIGVPVKTQATTKEERFRETQAIPISTLTKSTVEYKKLSEENQAQMLFINIIVIFEYKISEDQNKRIKDSSDQESRTTAARKPMPSSE